MTNLVKTFNFIREQFNSNEFIALHQPIFKGNEKKYVNDAIEKSQVSSTGFYIDQFEEKISKITNTKKAVAVVNGTAAIQIALRLIGVKQNDEVITQALTFIATINAITYNGAKPIFLDVDYDTMGLSPKAVEKFLEEYGEVREDGCYNKKTGNKISACLPMHTFGFPIHIDEMIAVCQKWKIPLVEDAAESIGSLYKNKPTGSFGLMSAISFNGNKIVTSGGGGAIVTNDIKLGEKAKYITTTAKVPHQYEYFHDELGYNYAMPNINAALACAQLEQLQLFLENKRALAAKYESFFKSEGIIFRTELPETKANYWLMCLEMENKKDRDLFLNETNKNNIMTRPIWQLMFRQPMYQDCQKDDQIDARKLEEIIVNIPSGVR